MHEQAEFLRLDPEGAGFSHTSPDSLSQARARAGAPPHPAPAAHQRTLWTVLDSKLVSATG